MIMSPKVSAALNAAWSGQPQGQALVIDKKHCIKFDAMPLEMRVIITVMEWSHKKPNINRERLTTKHASTVGDVC